MEIISDKFLAEGIHFCIKNSEIFLDTAKTLLKQGYYRESYLLILYSLEEMGKIMMIGNYLFYTDSSERMTLWKKRFRDHGEKFWFSRDLDDIFNKIIPSEKNKDEEKKTILKQNIAYVDFKKNKFVYPNKVTEKETRELINKANKRISSLKDNHPSIEEDEKNIRENFEELKNMSFDDLKERAIKNGFSI